MKLFAIIMGIVFAPLFVLITTIGNLVIKKRSYGDWDDDDDDF